MNIDSEIIKSKLAYKLSTLMLKEKHVIDPPVGNGLEQYVARLHKKRITDCGQTKFNQFIDLLKNMSAILVPLIENDYFAFN